tara:strand:- start:69473 stop:69712 length:240 start_codon:yes stop_codon:yes gene_type:complete
VLWARDHFAETVKKNITDPAQMPGMDGISRAFTNFGLTVNHNRDLFPTARRMDQTFAFLKGRKKGDVFTLGNRENLFFA